MPVEFKFDAHQPFQESAINAVADLFEGLQLAPTQFEVGPSAEGLLFTDAGLGNAMTLDRSVVSDNLRSVQELNAIPDEFRLQADELIEDLDFTVEMETGTGKTYVYLRTAFELHRRFGFTKFVVVVPSVAIREGVLSNLRLLRDHIRVLYDGTAYDSRVYEADDPGDLRAFAQSNQLQLLVMNIDSFNKTDANLIYRGRDKTMGVAPIEFLRATRPIVILDEPQNLEGEAARAGIKALHPLLTLRYSATHKRMPNPVYRLTPVDAYNQGLVKRIDVWSVREDEDLNKPFIRVDGIRSTSRMVTARVTIDVQGKHGVARKTLRIGPDKHGLLPDLHVLSGERDLYLGYVVEDIRADRREVLFGNGVRVREGETVGADRDLIQRTQIRTAVRQHLEKEQDLSDRFRRGDLLSRIKPLTLFFIDRVANYHPADGRFRIWFEEAYRELVPSFPDLNLPEVVDAHNGYFAVDRAGPKDTSGTTKADDVAYRLIMEQKDVLLSPDEPLRFIFSHSALREGWDNPNVFVIATLNETRSELKKRQEIGRGLRLPVMENGERSFDPGVNRLSVISNESYESFAAQLQREIEDETSVTFDKRLVGNARAKRPVVLRDLAVLGEDFERLWARISARTQYTVAFNLARVIDAAAERLAAESDVVAPYLRVSGAALEMDQSGVTTNAISAGRPTAAEARYPVPDLLGHLANSVPLSRQTIASILIQSGRLGNAARNPQLFMNQAQVAIEQALAEEMVHGIQYVPRTSGPDAQYAMSLLDEKQATTFSPTRLELAKSAFGEVMTGSGVEEAFALALQQRADVRLFMKLPWWFKVETPIGNYNPDWAIILDADDGESRCHLVRETKGAPNLASLPTDQRLKIRYGERHFQAIGVDYAWVTSADKVVGGSGES